MRQRLVVLDKMDIQTCLFGKIASIETFEEISPRIAENAGLDDKYTVNICSDDFHYCMRSLFYEVQ